MSKPARTRKCQLDALLAERGIFESAEEARPWIMTGQVLVNEQLIDKPGMLVPRDAVLRVRGRHRYVSRGGYKLEAAIERFRVNVAGRVALDCGASTGGFTDCLLQHGARLVYAVEGGYGQLVGSLRAEPRAGSRYRDRVGPPWSREACLETPPWSDRVLCLLRVQHESSMLALRAGDIA